MKDVAAAGNWKTQEVLVTSYQQADAETIENVVLHPTHRITGGRGWVAPLWHRGGQG